MKDYYKLKYLVTEAFYEDMFYEQESYTFGQTANKCFVDFCIPSRENEINFVIVTSTILARLAAHEPKELKYFLKEYEKMLEILKRINLNDYLEEEEEEDILFNIGCIETCVEKYVEKD